ncbi:DUF6286 domain-containing protein [Microlunatus soli]|uniref:DUF6286 domain-containing protein n=1 Tax=Microlunatus soli TaxID=630515 RepID=A0A1H1XDZ5_9ACTN|nr:DUF6286 domain-containing protein [Microlunatus soli]SDT07484.1 hypothetical protein SAMN04489812_4044 [Microlunatus soli]
MSGRTELPQRHRPSRVVPATITALVLLAIGVAALVAAGYRLATGSPDRTTAVVLSWLSGLRWNDAVLLTAAVVAVVVGLILIIAALRPGRPDVLQLSADRIGAGSVRRLDGVVPRRALARLINARVGSVDGVDRVQTSVDGRRIVIQARTATRYTEDVRQQIAAAVEHLLAETALEKSPRPRVVVRQV